jgi:predicted DNA-binding transcriptional regulator AlpA
MSHDEPAAPRLLNVTEAAQRLGMSVSFLNKARLSGEGPIFIKIGTRVAYDPADLAAWLDVRKRHSTSERPRAAL